MIYFLIYLFISSVIWMWLNLWKRCYDVFFFFFCEKRKQDCKRGDEKVGKKTEHFALSFCIVFFDDGLWWEKKKQSSSLKFSLTQFSGKNVIIYIFTYFYTFVYLCTRKHVKNVSLILTRHNLLTEHIQDLIALENLKRVALFSREE